MLEIKHFFKSSAELELTEFGTSFSGAIHGVTQRFCSFVVNSTICQLLIPQKSIVKTYPCHS